MKVGDKVRLKRHPEVVGNVSSHWRNSWENGHWVEFPTISDRPVCVVEGAVEIVPPKPFWPKVGDRITYNDGEVSYCSFDWMYPLKHQDLGLTHPVRVERTEAGAFEEAALVDLNDISRKSFAQIADYIEEHL